MACFEHVQERKFASGLKRAVLHAADGVRYQGLRVEFGRLGELELSDDRLNTSGVANPVWKKRAYRSASAWSKMGELPASPAQIST